MPLVYAVVKCICPMYLWLVQLQQGQSSKPNSTGRFYYWQDCGHSNNILISTLFECQHMFSLNLQIPVLVHWWWVYNIGIDVGDGGLGGNIGVGGICA